VSEHGRGRAVDVAAIILANGQAISVLEDWGKGRAGRILKAVRAAACGPFTTVLGPGSDAFHRNHLHMDTAHTNLRYCR
ncbi:MAG: extensin family protein, partial [Rhodobacteraceae bacterium]|nr:extensin family protein [Paracoccaceae bacterium]